jgi:predicted RNA-binding Zn-ribbon protein involved in translation (DUF1610 family)
MKCPICGFETDHFPALARHVKSKHSSNLCPVCGKRVKYLVKHASQRKDERHQWLYRCIWPEPRRRHSRKRYLKNGKPNGGKKRCINGVYLNKIADVMAKCRKERGLNSCEYCGEVLTCETVKMLIDRLAMRV